ncbi:MAG TPA: hypothetical protein VIY49_24970, partial [Bryobacteraceae bacterium]
GVRRMEKWKTKPRFPTFPRGARDDNNEIYLFKPKTEERKSAAARPPHPCQLLCIIKFFHDHSWIGKC